MEQAAKKGTAEMSKRQTLIIFSIVLGIKSQKELYIKSLSIWQQLILYVCDIAVILLRKHPVLNQIIFFTEIWKMSIVPLAT